MVREPEDSARWMPAERTWGEYLDPATLEGTGSMKGQRVAANYYLQTFEAKGGEQSSITMVPAAGVTRKAGKGRRGCSGPILGTTARLPDMNRRCSLFGS